MKEKEDNNKDIEEILNDIQKNIKPSKGPLTSIDPKKLAKAIDDVKVVKEIKKIVDKEKKNK